MGNRYGIARFHTEDYTEIRERLRGVNAASY